MAEKKIYTGQITEIPKNKKDIYTRYTKTLDILEKLKNTYDKYEAIDVIVNELPDGTAALNTYLHFTTQGGKFEFRNARTGRLTKKYDSEFRDFCKRIGKTNSSGLDGLNKEMAISSYTHGGMAVEILVKEDLSDIEEVLIVDPATFREYKWNEAEKRYAIYQQRYDDKQVDLYSGNFFYIPFQPKIGTPIGTLKFEPAIVTLTQYYQLIADSGLVLNRIGYPRYVLTIDSEALLNTATAQQKSDPVARERLFNEAFTHAAQSLRGIGKDNDVITFSTNKIEVLGGAMNGSGIDVRAWFEVLEPLICNSFQLPPVLMARQQSGSYALGTAEMKSFTDTVDSMRENIKRLNEEIANMWARVKGYNVTARYIPTPLDWQKQIDKWQAKLLELEFARRCEEYGYYDKPTASQLITGNEKPNLDSQGIYEYLKKSVSSEDIESGVQKLNE